MIIVMVGGIGSGKTLSAVREIKNSKNIAVTNFKLKNIDYKRLKFTDILVMKNKKWVNVNWKYWEQMRRKNFSIYLDEAHNVIHSRASMTKRNILMSKWISQIRKILCDSPNNHIFILTQTPRKIDVNFRELAQVVISCHKKEIRGKIYIIQKFYDGFGAYENNISSGKRFFCGNEYFRFYDTKDLISFEEADEYV